MDNKQIKSTTMAATISDALVKIFRLNYTTEIR